MYVNCHKAQISKKVTMFPCGDYKPCDYSNELMFLDFTQNARFKTPEKMPCNKTCFCEELSEELE